MYMLNTITLFLQLNNTVFTFSIRYMNMMEFGLNDYWVKEITPKAAECFVTEKPGKIVRLVPIHLYDLISAFLILGIGIGMATLCFLLELIYMRVKRHI